jgi:hypothetical protein
LEERPGSEYTPRRLSYPYQCPDEAVSRRVRVRVSEDHTIGCEPVRPARTHPPITATPAAVAVVRSTPRATNVSSASCLSRSAETAIQRVSAMAGAQGDASSIVKWVKDTPESNIRETWVVRRYPDSYSVSSH